MKITQERLKQIISEELEDLGELNINNSQPDEPISRDEFIKAKRQQTGQKLASDASSLSPADLKTQQQLDAIGNILNDTGSQSNSQIIKLLANIIVAMQKGRN